MRALRRVVVTRAAAAAAAGAAVLAASGCAKFDAALGKQEAVVSFTPGTSQATMMSVRAACAKIPGATAEAVPKDVNTTSGAYSIRFRVDSASNADIARLSSCLGRFKSVQGVNIEQQDGS
jgi:ABC-type glycerol-3-phosphate transport system substrate-binding protein